MIYQLYLRYRLSAITLAERERILSALIILVFILELLFSSFLVSLQYYHRHAMTSFASHFGHIMLFISRTLDDEATRTIGYLMISEYPVFSTA